MVTAKLKKVKRLALVGLGGTGSYVLDFVAKTPVSEIHLYDKDPFLQHNAFRAPGAPSLAELEAQTPKATWFKDIYSKMHSGIVDHPVYIDASADYDQHNEQARPFPQPSQLRRPREQ
jgi:tRNA A37 threonylcarbamoyladenosine dehydratase